MAGRAIRSVAVNFTANISDFERQLNTLTRRLNRTSKDLKKVGSTLNKAITLPVLAVGTATTKMAMDAIESENLFDTSMKGMASAARKWSEQISDDLKLNPYDVRNSMGGYNNLASSMGIGADAAYEMSKGISKLKYDLASFFNVTNQQSGKDLNAIFTGETEPLRKYGVVLNETTLKLWAAKNGLIQQGQEMSEAQKIIARYNVVLEQTKTAQGDLARTMDSPLNKTRALKERASELSIEIGKKLIPIQLKLALVLNSVLEWFSKLNPTSQNTILIMAGLAGAIGPVVLSLSALVKGVAMATTALKFLISGPAGLLILGGTLAATALGIHKFNKEQEKARLKAYETAAGFLKEKDSADKLNQALAGVSLTQAKADMQKYGDAWWEAVQGAETAMKYLQVLERMAENPNSPDYYRAQDELVRQRGLTEELKKKVQETKKKFDAAKDAVAAFSAIELPKVAETDLKDTLVDWDELFKKLGTTGTETYDKLGDKIKDFVNDIKQQTDAYKNFVGLFDKANADQAIGMDRWINRLKGQVRALTQYQSSIKTLEAKAKAGVISQGLFADLRALGPSAAKQLQILANSTNAQLKEANALYGQKGSIASNLAYDAVKNSMTTENKIVQIINQFNGGAKDEEIVRISDKITQQIIKKLKALNVI